MDWLTVTFSLFKGPMIKLFLAKYSNFLSYKIFSTYNKYNLAWIVLKSYRNFYEKLRWITNIHTHTHLVRFFFHSFLMSFFFMPLFLNLANFKWIGQFFFGNLLFFVPRKQQQQKTNRKMTEWVLVPKKPDVPTETNTDIL